MANNVLLDLNNPVFQGSLFALQKQTQLDFIRSLDKIRKMTWQMVHQDKGLRWEKISSIEPPEGINCVYSIRISQSTRAIVYRQDEFMRFLGVFEDHDAAYGKK
jgi:hypothetical protein